MLRRANPALPTSLWSSQAMPTYKALRTIEEVRKTRAGIQHEAAALHMRSAVGRTMLSRLEKIRRNPEAAGRLKIGLVGGRAIARRR